MPSITLTLSDARYAALRKTQELMALSGGAAKTPDEYLQAVVDSACDSYAQQYPDAAPSAAEVAIYKDAAVKAEARAAAEAEKAEAAKAQVLALQTEKEAAASASDQLDLL